MAQKKASLTKILSVILTLILVALVILPPLGMYAAGRDVYVKRSQQVGDLMVREPVFFETTFTHIFPEALACQPFNTENCKQHIGAQFSDLMTPAQSPELGSSWGSDELRLVPQLPLYFIQLKGDQIAKVFMSGDVKVEPVDTQGEANVRDVLLGKKKVLYGRQSNSMPEQLQSMKYLKDLYSEAEVIIPYYHEGRIVGAVVFLHGD